MQLKALHKNIYRLSAYALRHQNHKGPDAYEIPVAKWRLLKSQGVPDLCCARVVGISRATYYRYQKKLAALTAPLGAGRHYPLDVRKSFENLRLGRG